MDVGFKCVQSRSAVGDDKSNNGYGDIGNADPKRGNYGMKIEEAEISWPHAEHEKEQMAKASKGLGARRRKQSHRQMEIGFFRQFRISGVPGVVSSRVCHGESCWFMCKSR